MLIYTLSEPSTPTLPQSFYVMIEKDITGQLVLIMAPSGSGKGFLISYLRVIFQDTPSVHFAVSYTTRVPRPGEVDGHVYHFISREVFEERMRANFFLEWAEYSGHFYGTPRDEVVVPLQQGKVVVREVELQGVLAIRERISAENRRIIFIDGGSWDILRERIIARAPISVGELELRRERYLEEVSSKAFADIVLDNSGNKVAAAKQRLVEIVNEAIAHVESLKK
jgi:guanylate kinase